MTEAAIVSVPVTGNSGRSYSVGDSLDLGCLASLLRGAHLTVLDDWSNRCPIQMSTAVATTKERILDAAEDLMLAKSFHSVGLNEILSAVKVPKGLFYHYFTSKEQFGVELIRTTFRRRLLSSGACC
jgi:AcrR family transcriptional regulator